MVARGGVALAEIIKVLFLRQVRRLMLAGGWDAVCSFIEENDGTTLFQEPDHNANSKHIEVRHQFTREIVAREAHKGQKTDKCRVKSQ